MKLRRDVYKRWSFSGCDQKEVPLSTLSETIHEVLYPKNIQIQVW